jgi:hypothetical protein
MSDDTSKADGQQQREVMQQAIAKLQGLHTEASAEADKRQQGEMAAYHVGKSHAYDDAARLLERLLAA